MELAGPPRLAGERTGVLGYSPLIRRLRSPARLMCPRMASTQTSSPVLHGRRRASARLREKTVLLEADGVRRRIPVAAIERVVVHGAGGGGCPSC
ncbi:hypothetical protein BX257_8907 [Streptomyces sp. 3212.3]|nr:hypothetical protein ADL25_31355 [Streptomyces sp. NRRL F-5122]REE66101.1 hypothetical protein BX257_8907 [Streptomyces sp. 3212.3]